jgi:Na+-driven multidrug efflux pump
VDLMEVFTDDPQVVRVGVDYLRIVAWSFVASGIVFVSSSMFQALGNTIPPLLTSLTRIVIVTVPVIALSRTPGFRLDTIWYLSAIAIGVQMFVNVALLNRELRRRLPDSSAELDQPSLSA